MSTYRNAVKVRRVGPKQGAWRATCPACGWVSLHVFRCHDIAMTVARRHAAACPDLHWRNWEAACPSCKAYGRIAPACPVCLGYGFERERDGLE